MTIEQRQSVCEYIGYLLESLPAEERAEAAEFIAVEAALMGATSIYEGIGILDIAKRSYTEVYEEIVDQKMLEDSCDCGCGCAEKVQVPIIKTDKKHIN